MSDLVPSKSITITNLLANLDNVKTNPSSIQRVVLDYLAEVVDGKVNIVDPTNPFIFLLEASAVNTALAINENDINLRRQHARLAQTPEDVYMHMSDIDFLDRFAIPVETEFTLVVQTNDIVNKLKYDEAERCYKGIIPRDTEFLVDGVYYTLQYPIVIRKYNNGSVQISYDVDKVSPVQTLSTNIIDYVLRTDTDLVSWVFFNVKVKQFKVDTFYFPIQESAIFSEDILFKDKFYFARVYYRNNSTSNTWKEIYTTHGDQVYDIYTPTSLLKITGDNLNVAIPLIYTKTGKISGEIRVDILTTKGVINLDYSSYKLTAFGLNLKAIDEDNDLNDYTNTFRDLAYYTYCDKIVTGGSDGLNYEDIRERVIFNSAGPQQLPITNKQISAAVANQGFDLVTDVDTVTNRIFLATRKLGDPRNPKLLTAANLGINTLSLTPEQTNYNGAISTLGSRTTIKSNCLFENDNGVLKFIDPNSILNLGNQVIVAKNIEKQYLYNPFYYVLDSSKTELEVRAYNLDFPDATNLNFISQNNTLSLAVNTGLYAITKIKDGYRLIITTKSGNFYKQIQDSSVGMQISFYPNGEDQQAYIEGTLLGRTATNERIYQFDILSSYDIDGDSLLEITNASMFTNEALNTRIDLDTKFHIYYTTNSITNTYVRSESDSLIASFMLPPGTVCITHETLQINLGESLKNLWVRSRTIPGMVKYKTYPSDIPLTYDTDIYDKDPITGQFFDIVNGEIVYRILHKSGDIVLDGNNQALYLHRQGDVILDQLGRPVTDGVNSIAKEVDLLLIDGKYFFATDKIVESYRAEIVGELVNWIVDDLGLLQQRLLEQTKIYYYPKTSLGTITVEADGQEAQTISAEQSITVDLMVTKVVYQDYDHRSALESTTVQIIDELIAQPEVNIKTIEDKLLTLYGNSVVSFKVYGLGGSNNYTYVKLDKSSNQLCLKKKLIIQPDNSIVIKEDLTVNFVLV